MDIYPLFNRYGFIGRSTWEIDSDGSRIPGIESGMEPDIEYTTFTESHLDETVIDTSISKFSE